MRLRSALAAALVVALALAGAAVVLVLLLQQSVRDNAAATATTRAQDVAAQLASDGVASEELNLQPGAGETAIVQVLSSGQVVAASSTIEGEPALTTLAPSPGQFLLESAARLPVGEGNDRYQLVALGVADVQGADTVVVAQSFGPGEDTIDVVITALVVGTPALVLVVGVATYVLVGRSLRPVEAIRRRTAAISGADLSARVPVPSTGDEIARLAVTMNAMLDRLSDAQAAQRRFVSDASHELRSPLATLRAQVEVAAGHPELTDWVATAGGVRAESIRMQRLVEDLLTLAKADERGMATRWEEVDLDDLAEAEVRRLRQLHAPTHTVSSSAEGLPGHLSVQARIVATRVLGDRSQLAQVLRNLVDNAATHATSVVAIRVGPTESGGALVEVADDGPGIVEAHRGAVFDRFARLDASRARYSGGSGLGLAIVRELVTTHAGTVEVDRDDVLGGARFRVHLPGAR